MYFTTNSKRSVSETRNHHNSVIRTEKQFASYLSGEKRTNDAQAEVLTSSFAAFRSTSNGFYRSET